MTAWQSMDIEANLKTYLGERRPTARYTSFDYCFNYFQSHREHGLTELVAGPNLQLSCLQLGFYLASWGMLRASSVLLQKSIKHYVPIVHVIAASPPEIWNIDVHCYTKDNCGLVLETARRLRGALPDDASDILVTKIMLGVFGCVPAFDTYFKKGFGAWTVGAGSLMRIANFYGDNRDVIDRHRVHTLDFDTGMETARPYTRAKVVDMIFFIEGGR
jgi:hypothetical protein